MRADSRMRPVFDATLVQPHVMQHMVERDHLQRRVLAIARLVAQGLQPAQHLLVEFGMRAHGVEHALAVLHQPRQDLVEIGDGESIVGSVFFHRPIRPCAPPIPGLAQWITIAHEQNVFSCRPARHQHRHSLRFSKTGQVLEVAVLPVGVLDIIVAGAGGRGRHDGDAVAPHQPRQLPATARVFGIGGLQFAGPCHHRRRTGLPLCGFQCSTSRRAWRGGSRKGCSWSYSSCTPTRTNSTSSA